MECWQLRSAAFTLLLGPLEDVLAEHLGAYDEQVKRLETDVQKEKEKERQGAAKEEHRGDDAAASAAMLVNAVSKKDLVKAGLLGKGSFGTVWLYQNCETKET